MDGLALIKKNKDKLISKWWLLVRYDLWQAAWPPFPTIIYLIYRKGTVLHNCI